MSNQSEKSSIEADPPLSRISAMKNRDACGGPVHDASSVQPEYPLVRSDTQPHYPKCPVRREEARLNNQDVRSEGRAVWIDHMTLCMRSVKDINTYESTEYPHRLRVILCPCV